MSNMSDRYGSLKEESSDEPGGGAYVEHDGLIRTDDNDDDDDGSDMSDDEDDVEFSIHELLYSSASYYAIAKPVTLTMVLAAIAVCFVNDDATRSQGAAAMSAYQTWNPNAGGNVLALSFANALVMVTVICCMTFVIVLLYRFKCMKLLIGYMIFASASLLGLLGGHLMETAIGIYNIPLDKISFVIFMANFAVVGVVAVFYGKGVPKLVTQGYLIATSVILAWHLSFFDDWTAWSLLLMLALYDLCAVLTPCGPLKALVNLMSKDDAPEMPGLLFEAELPTEAKRRKPKTNNSATTSDEPNTMTTHRNVDVSTIPRETKIPLAIAKVYQLAVVSIPDKSIPILYPKATDVPLLAGTSEPAIPDDPTPKQLQALVVVRLPAKGGRIEQVLRKGKKVYLERDRHGTPKRILWVDNNGKVFAELKSDDEDVPESNSIRLGLGDFIFYSVLVAKAAQYSFTTFAACMLVILAGLGGTLVLLSVYGHALPALPISIFLGVVLYGTTRLFVLPFVQAVLTTPYYV